MYLSEVGIPRNVQNVYDVHRHVWSLFPSKNGQERPFLFREQPEETALVLSSVLPDKGTCIIRETEFNVSFEKNRAYQFVLRANPSRRSLADAKRVPFFGDMAVEWIRRVFSRGAEIKHVSIDREYDISFKKGRAAHKVDIHVVDFSGAFKCTDINEMKRIFESGIGPGKSFGLGLLLFGPMN